MDVRETSEERELRIQGAGKGYGGELDKDCCGRDRILLNECTTKYFKRIDL